MEQITSRTNALCTHIRKLAASAAYRRRQGEFLCDSPKLLEEALLHGGDVRVVVCTEEAALPPVPAAIRFSKGAHLSGVLPLTRRCAPAFPGLSGERKAGKPRLDNGR